jgi:hypothetical protein
MRFFCPSCWKDFPEDFDRCPACGFDIDEGWRNKPRIEKLIHALQHPDSQTQLRAAWLLGLTKDQAAVPYLIQWVGNASEVYSMEAGIKALRTIGGEQADQFLLGFKDHPSVLIREQLRDFQPKATNCGDQIKKGE